MVPTLDPPGTGAILETGALIWTNLVKDHYALLLRLPVSPYIFLWRSTYALTSNYAILDQPITAV